jgi:hypothetical protein
MPRRMSDNVLRGGRINLTVDQVNIIAFAGETLATVLLAEGIQAFNETPTGRPRAPFCNMGTCFECQVRVAAPGASGYRWLRACLCRAEDGMSVITGASLVDGGSRDAED